MSITVGEFTVEPENCSPFIARLLNAYGAERTAVRMLSDRVRDLESRVRLFESQVRVMGATKPPVSESSNRATVAKLDEAFIEEHLAKEDGAEASIIDIFVVYREYQRFNPGRVKSMTKKELVAALSERFGEHFQPTADGKRYFLVGYRVKDATEI